MAEKQKREVMTITKLMGLLECFEDGIEVYITIIRDGMTYRTECSGVVLDDIVEGDDGEKRVLTLVGGVL